MLPEYNPKTRTLTLDNQTYSIKSRKRTHGYEVFTLPDERRIISNGDIFFWVPNSQYGVRRMRLYLNRPPIPAHLLPITPSTLINSFEDGMAIYYGITGACTKGLDIWLTRIPPQAFPAPIAALVLLTRNEFGGDLLREYLQPSGRRLFEGKQNLEGSLINHPDLSDLNFLCDKEDSGASAQ
jgi:hypothetical protein